LVSVQTKSSPVPVSLNIQLVDGIDVVIRNLEEMIIGINYLFTLEPVVETEICECERLAVSEPSKNGKKWSTLNGFLR
jgi:hypothetical protein